MHRSETRFVDRTIAWPCSKIN